MDTGYYNETNNLFNKLLESCVINNNIFGYEIIPKINLVYYPDEILFYNGSGNTKEVIRLSLNTTFDANHTLYQNKTLNQNNKLYYIEYQFLVKEPEYNKFCQTTKIISENPRGRFEFEFIPKTFYGRKNILYFKLCHNYCDSCIELGISEIEQKYFNYSENYI